MKNTDYPPIIRTNRLVLRQWNNTDLEPFDALNADPRVMEYFPSTLSRIYKKLEYSVEFTREGYDKNSKMFMLRKAL